jgi:hypothetical protein
MLLDYAGTKKDISRLGISLTEGMEITVYSDSSEDEDLELDGLVRFGVIPETEGRPGWYADTRGNEIRYVKRNKPEQSR